MTQAMKVRDDALLAHVKGLEDFSKALMILAELMPDRATTSQACFFLMAARADLAGRPATFTEIKEKAGETIGKSMHTTYKVFLKGSRRTKGAERAGLEWLTAIENPDDNRQKFLKLTPSGRRVISELAPALPGFIGKD